MRAFRLLHWRETHRLLDTDRDTTKLIRTQPQLHQCQTGARPTRNQVKQANTATDHHFFVRPPLSTAHQEQPEPREGLLLSSNDTTQTGAAQDAKATTQVFLLPHFVGEEYFVTTLLVVAIVLLALLPTGSVMRQNKGLSDQSTTTAENGVELVPLVTSEVESPKAIDLEARKDLDASLKESPRGTAKTVLVINFALWNVLAMFFNAQSKIYLRSTHDPVGLLVLQGGTGAVVLFLLGRVGVVDVGAELPPPAARQLNLAGLGHSAQALFTNVSVFVGGVAVTNALKAMEPVAAAVLSYFLLGKTITASRMAALATVVAGILILTSTGGKGGSDSILIAAVFTFGAVLSNAFRNVILKKGATPIPPHRTLFVCSVAATGVGVAVMLIRAIDNDVVGDPSGPRIAIPSWLTVVGLQSALGYVGFQFASFNILACLSPVGHAVGNSCKRVVVFGSGIFLLGEVMNVQQLCGVAIAMIGVLAYGLLGTTAVK